MPKLSPSIALTRPTFWVPRSFHPDITLPPFNRDDHGALLKQLQRVESDLVMQQVGKRLAGNGAGPYISRHDSVFSCRRDLPVVESAFRAQFASMGSSLQLKAVGIFYYEPTIFGHEDTVRKTTRVLLSLGATILGNYQDRTPERGLVVAGSKTRVSTVRLGKVITDLPFLLSIALRDSCHALTSRASSAALSIRRCLPMNAEAQRTRRCAELICFVLVICWLRVNT
jgi:hypothetical protein